MIKRASASNSQNGGSVIHQKSPSEEVKPEFHQDLHAVAANRSEAARATHLPAPVEPRGVLGSKEREARVCSHDFLCFCHEQLTVVIQQSVQRL